MCVMQLVNASNLPLWHEKNDNAKLLISMGLSQASG